MFFSRNFQTVLRVAIIENGETSLSKTFTKFAKQHFHGYPLAKTTFCQGRRGFWKKGNDEMREDRWENSLAKSFVIRQMIPRRLSVWTGHFNQIGVTNQSVSCHFSFTQNPWLNTVAITTCAPSECLCASGNLDFMRIFSRSNRISLRS